MSRLERFRQQAESQIKVLTHGVLALERDPSALEPLGACIQAARSLKGVAAVAGLGVGADLAGDMEECFAAAQRDEMELSAEQIDLLLEGAGLLDRMATLPQNMAARLVELAGSAESQREAPSRASTLGADQWQMRARNSLLRCQQLIACVEDMVNSSATVGEAARAGSSERDRSAANRCKRVLVVDNSLAVRELERKLLSHRGYDVQMAVDGVDAWNLIRQDDFDLVVAGFDMPLVDGLRLTRLIRSDPRLQTLPVLMVLDNFSEQDRWRSFDAGADYYVIKGTFHDTLVQSVADLIGAAQSVRA